MQVKDDLGLRMKTFYEQIPKTRLMRRCPVALRLDGRAFHTFTRGFQKPFDGILMKTMQEVMKYLCENIQGCVLGYTQSDEITLVLIDYLKFTSDAWFDYEVQKICSVSASMATMTFNKYFSAYVKEWEEDHAGDDAEEVVKLRKTYRKALDCGAMFDSRCFNIPKEEVTNLLYWRQLDASRNSIQMVGQANFTHKELQNQSCNKIQDMLMLQRGINWNDLPVSQKRGSCCIKVVEVQGEVERSKWIIDENIPIFSGEGREYIEKLIYVGEA